MTNGTNQSSGLNEQMGPASHQRKRDKLVFRAKWTNQSSEQLWPTSHQGKMNQLVIRAKRTKQSEQRRPTSQSKVTNQSEQRRPNRHSKWDQIDTAKGTNWSSEQNRPTSFQDKSNQLHKVKGLISYEAKMDYLAIIVIQTFISLLLILRCCLA